MLSSHNLDKDVSILWPMILSNPAGNWAFLHALADNMVRSIFHCMSLITVWRKLGMILASKMSGNISILSTPLGYPYTQWSIESIRRLLTGESFWKSCRAWPFRSCNDIHWLRFHLFLGPGLLNGVQLHGRWAKGLWDRGVELSCGGLTRWQSDYQRLGSCNRWSPLPCTAPLRYLLRKQGLLALRHSPHGVLALPLANPQFIPFKEYRAARLCYPRTKFRLPRVEYACLASSAAEVSDQRALQSGMCNSTSTAYCLRQAKTGMHYVNEQG